jgi:RHS repeat-associated protein
MQSFTVGESVAQIYYVHPDHLGTPRAITTSDASNTKVWEWSNLEPFGNNVPDENPSGLGNFTYNNRFPGQYFDQETNTSYNYFRDYDPATGRYVQSDPIGLEGGLNTYTYVFNAPLTGSDPTGLIEHNSGQWKDCGKGCRIRIDTTIVNGQVSRHLHWECKKDSGECGENGEKSHGGSWDDAPENIKQCALRHGFRGAPSPAPAPSNSSSYSVPPWVKVLGVGVGVGAVAACAFAEPCGVILGGASLLGGAAAAQ